MPFATRIVGPATGALLALSALTAGAAEGPVSAAAPRDPREISLDTGERQTRPEPQPAPAAPGEQAPPAAEPPPAPPASPAETAPATVDAFGVPMLYPTRPGGEQWALGEEGAADPRFEPQRPITRNADGSWKMRGDKVRMQVLTSTGYLPRLMTTQDREVLAQQGYMQSPNDWRNVEITGFVRLNEASNPTDNFTWYARGGHHSDSIACEGSSYKGGLYFDGRARWEKESWHVSYDNSPYKTVTTPLQGRWVGFKAVMRNVEVNGRPAVRLESWLNDSGDGATWEKVYEWVDAGDWGGDSGPCGATDPAMPLTWGGPVVTFRWDGAQDVDFKWLSVREIE